MRLLEIAAVSLIAVLVVLAAVFGRREFFARAPGTVQLHFRLHHRPRGGGWAPGFAQFRGDELRWYRLFSLAPRPRRRLPRRRLSVRDRRTPTVEEARLIPPEWVILSCDIGREQVEVAMSRHTVTGFLSWLESATPRST